MTKVGPTLNKLQQKLFMLNLTPKGVFFNISKVLRNPSSGRLSVLAIQIGHLDLKLKWLSQDRTILRQDCPLI